MRPEHVLSASNRLSQSEWQEAVSNYLANIDDLTLCPGSELLSPVEKQVRFSFLTPLLFDFPSVQVTHLTVFFGHFSFQICQSLRLKPLYYTSLKTNLILVIIRYFYCALVSIIIDLFLFGSQSGTDKTPLLPGLAVEEQAMIVNYFTKAGFLSVE